MTQWEEWDNAPLPISADDAWKEMEKLLDKNSSGKAPVPFIPPMDNGKRKKKRFVVWWVILLGMVLLGSILLIGKKEAVPNPYLPTEQNVKASYHSNTRATGAYTPNPSVKALDTSKKEVRDQGISNKNNSHQTNRSDNNTGPSNDVVPTSFGKGNKLIAPKPKRDNKGTEDNSFAKSNPISHKENQSTSHFTVSNPSIKTGGYAKRNKQKSSVKQIHASDIASSRNGLPPKTISHKRPPLTNATTFSGTLKHHKKKFERLLANDLNKQTQSSATKSEVDGPDIIGSNKKMPSSISSTENSDGTNVYNHINNKDSAKNDNLAYHKFDTTKVAPPKDAAAARKDSVAKKKFVFTKLSAGLQWSACLPMTNNNNNTQKQLIPGLWLAKGIGSKSSLSLSVNPFVMQTNKHIVVENKNQSLGSLATGLKLDSSWYVTDSLSGYHLDTTIQVNRTATLLQTFGYRITLNYKYQIIKKWQLSVGAEYNKIISAYINDKIIRVVDSIVAKNASADYQHGSDLWNLFQHNYFSGSAAIDYLPVDWLSVSIGIHQPFKSITNNTNQGVRPSTYFVNLRWRLWRLKK